MEVLDGLPILALSQSGLLLLVVLMFLRGWVVPRRALDDEREDTAQWREAHRLSEKARAVQAEQTRLLLTHAETTNALLKSITEAKP